MKIKFGNSVWKPVLVVMNPCKITVVDAATNLMESYCTKATKHLILNYRREYGAQKVSCNFKILMIFLFLMLYLCIKKVKQNSAMGSVKHLCVIVQELNTMTPLSLEYSDWSLTAQFLCLPKAHLLIIFLSQGLILHRLSKMKVYAWKTSVLLKKKKEFENWKAAEAEYDNPNHSISFWPMKASHLHPGLLIQIIHLSHFLMLLHF